MIKIVSDSTCDLSPELVERYNISIVPLHILLGEAEYEDGRNITIDDIYRWSDANKTTPKTSAPSMDTVISIIKPLLDQGDELICFAISEDMSTSANVMRLAADELDYSDKVHVINSMNLSTGIGLLVIEAAIMANEGKSSAEIIARINELIPYVRASFVVDTLVYLHRGGRCNGLAAMVGGALKLHPMITVVGGKMIPGKKYRGNLSKVIKSYVTDLEPALKHAKKDRVFITHSTCDKEIIEEVRKYLESLNIFDEIHETCAGGVVSSHCGPGTLGVLFIEEQEA
jgi:DegV family protein with EDD domain